MGSGCGKTLKVLAVIIGILGVIGAFVLGATFESFGIGIGVGAALASLISALMLYGFGEMVDNTASSKFLNYEMNECLKKIEKKLNAAPAPKAQAEIAMPQPEKLPEISAEEREKRSIAANIAVAVYEPLGSAKEIYEKFYETHKDNYTGDDAACACRLKKLVEKEESTGNSKNNALSLLKSFYKHGGRIYAVDRSDSTFRCPSCGNKIFSDRKSCHHCGALFRD